MVKQLRHYHRWLIAAAVLIPLLTTCVLIGANLSRRSCSEPTFIRPFENVDETILRDLKQSVDWPNIVDETVVVSNIRVHRSGSLWNNLLNDDPTYGIQADVRLLDAENNSHHLLWKTWRYGQIFCPFVIVYGDGPPGDFTMLATNSR